MFVQLQIYSSFFNFAWGLICVYADNNDYYDDYDDYDGYEDYGGYDDYGFAVLA